MSPTGGEMLACLRDMKEENRLRRNVIIYARK